MTVDKTIYDKRELTKKISFLADLQRRFEKAKAKGFKGDIRQFRENLLKEKYKDILNRSGLSKGGKPNGVTTMTSDDWDIWLQQNDPNYMTLEEEEKLSKRKVPNKLVAEATDEQHKEADRLWKLELKKMELDPYYLPEIIDPEDVEISKRKSTPRKLLAYKFGATSQKEEDLIGRHVDDWTNAINKGELDPSVDFMQYINMILGRDSVSRGGIISVI